MEATEVINEVLSNELIKSAIADVRFWLILVVGIFVFLLIIVIIELYLIMQRL